MQVLSLQWEKEQTPFTEVFAHVQWTGVRDLPEVGGAASAGLLAERIATFAWY